MHEICELMNIWVTTLRNEMEYVLWHEIMRWNGNDMICEMLCAALYGMKWMWMQEYEMKWKWNEMEMKWMWMQDIMRSMIWYVLYEMECKECVCKNMKWNENENVNARLMRNMKVMCCIKWNVNDMYCMKWNVKMWMQEYERKWKMKNECECKTAWEMWDVMSCMKWNMNLKHMKYEMAVWLMCMYEMCDRTKNENECLALW